jgi:MFS superfamily sulfate permease-like transporter
MPNDLLVGSALTDTLKNIPLAGLGAVAICVGIEFSSISMMTRLPNHAARSIV